MSFKNYKDDSRKNWGTSDARNLSDDEIKLGAILRIADATEAMAKNHVQLMAQRDAFERSAKYHQSRAARLDRSNAALRGVITKLKKAAHS